MSATGDSGGVRDFLDPSAYEPDITDPADLCVHRKRRLAVAYRVFGAMGWGSLGDGHISARDPARPDCFWLGRYGVPFRHMTTDDLVLVGPDGSIEGGGHINVAAYYIHAPVHEARPEIASAVTLSHALRDTVLGDRREAGTDLAGVVRVLRRSRDLRR